MTTAFSRVYRLPPPTAPSGAIYVLESSLFLFQDTDWKGLGQVQLAPVMVGGPEGFGGLTPVVEAL